DVDNSSVNKRTAVIDANCRPVSSDACDTQLGAEWQRRMSGGQLVRIDLHRSRSVFLLCKSWLVQATQPVSPLRFCATGYAFSRPQHASRRRLFDWVPATSFD